MTRRFLDVSSGHLSPDTWTWLDTHLGEDKVRDPRNLVAAQLGGGCTRYGWLVYATDASAVALPADLANVLTKARKQGADYVLFDGDAQPNQDLPILHPGFASDA